MPAYWAAHNMEIGSMNYDQLKQEAEAIEERMLQRQVGSRPVTAGLASRLADVRNAMETMDRIKREAQERRVKSKANKSGRTTGSSEKS